MPALDNRARALLRSFAATSDPVALFRQMGHTPDPWQVEALRSEDPRRAMLAARQVGKGEVLTTRGLHKAAFTPDAVVGILTPGLRQSCRLLRRIRRALPAVPHVQATNKATTSLTLSNGSEVIAWPGNNPDQIRGDTLDLLLVDEAAWVLPEAFTAALPMLGMSGGAALLASTPGGPDGYLFDVFNDPDKGEGWARSFVTADDCPRYTEQAKAELRRTLGDVAYAVEMMCEWREGADAVFSAAELARILGTELIPDVLPGEAPLPEEGDDWTPSRLVLPTF